MEFEPVFKELFKTMDTYKTAIKALQKESALQKEEIRLAREENIKRDIKIENLEKESVSHKREIEIQNDEIKVLKTFTTRIWSPIEKLQKQIKELQPEIETLKHFNSVTIVESTNRFNEAQNLKDEIRTLKKQFEKHKEEIEEQLKTLNSKNQIQIANLCTSIRDFKNEIKDEFKTLKKQFEIVKPWTNNESVKNQTKEIKDLNTESKATQKIKKLNEILNCVENQLKSLWNNQNRLWMETPRKDEIKTIEESLKTCKEEMNKNNHYILNNYILPLMDLTKENKKDINYQIRLRNHENEMNDYRIQAEIKKLKQGDFEIIGAEEVEEKIG